MAKERPSTPTLIIYETLEKFEHAVFEIRDKQTKLKQKYSS